MTATLLGKKQAGASPSGATIGQYLAAITSKLEQHSFRTSKISTAVQPHLCNSYASL
jgi:hypothetical protein